MRRRLRREPWRTQARRQFPEGEYVMSLYRQCLELVLRKGHAAVSGAKPRRTADKGIT